MNPEIIFDLTALDLLFITLIAILGAGLQASAGFGSGLVAVPLLGLVNTDLVPGPILFSYLFLTSFMAWRERSEISYKDLRFILFGLVLGTLVGVVVLLNVNSQYFALIAALIVLAGVLISLFSGEIVLNKINNSIAGMLAGIMSTLAGLSGPPLALLLQHQQAAFIRANLAISFIFASIFSITALGFSGNFAMQDVWLGFCVLPGVILGYLLGQPIAKRITQAQSRRAILVISFLSAISLLVKSLA